ncbi:AAA family ATPase [Lichenifustis flavocetrariae]|uniref:AAA family ATPase n=1 Tax=Lichenifustis flavocetrariae TaxID=2949735 RepID=A0AA41YZR9_9HYPH|nr:AAA family ATPase [Lichenifustis flavocetrariae]MCW6507898.1 AAA family ATPase [Lichenifustis flavocetrariae]
MLTTLAVESYRSLRKLVIPLAPLAVITGPNGSGKSSLYRALRLLADTCQGSLVASLAREGGLPSTLWAGPHEIGRGVKSGQYQVEGLRRHQSVHLRLGFAADDFGYAIDLGLPSQTPPSAFNLDPEIKRECLWSGPVLRPSTLLVDRRGPSLRVTDATGAWQHALTALPPYDSMMTAFADPRGAPEMIVLRERVRGWRFYDNFRTDSEAPARHMQIGTRSPILSHDGANLAAALQTIREIGDAAGLDQAVDEAFPGAEVIVVHADGRFQLTMRQHGLLRTLGAAELSDGTLRYLLLVAALLTPRPPELLVFNEPEASLHPELLPALAALIGRAAARSQIVVVSHNAHLVSLLRDGADTGTIELEKAFGETRIKDLDAADRPRWEWPAR